MPDFKSENSGTPKISLSSADQISTASQLPDSAKLGITAFPKKKSLCQKSPVQEMLRVRNVGAGGKAGGGAGSEGTPLLPEGEPGTVLTASGEGEGEGAGMGGKDNGNPPLGDEHRVAATAMVAGSNEMVVEV
ncbi:hypothetical protein FB451DRAFT_1181579 [Mycena latifolia]|nr:hypothetical protein FB451DRAFT_1181579 [Mycena latifolia]